MIGNTSGTEAENRQKLVTYLNKEYPVSGSGLEFSTRQNEWLIEQVYMTKIIKDLGGVPDQVQQTPYKYFESLVYKLQGVNTTLLYTAGKRRLEVLQHYCR